MNNQYDLVSKIVTELHLDLLLTQMIPPEEPLMASWGKIHEQLSRVLRASPLNSQDLLLALSDADRVIHSLLTHRSIKFETHNLARTAIAQLMHVDERVWDEFIETKSLLVLIKEKLKTAHHVHVKETLHALPSVSEEIEQYVLAQIPQLNVDLPINEALGAYDLHFNELNIFMSRLIDMNNQSGSGFRACMDLLAKEITAEQGLVFSFEQMIRLCTLLGQPYYDDMASTLSIILQSIYQNPNLSDTQLSKVLEHIEYLDQFKSLLSLSAYQTFLSLSLQHFLSKGEVFPLNKFLEYKSLEPLNNEGSKVVYAAILYAFNPLPSNINYGLLEQIITKTMALIEAKAEAAPELVLLLTLLIKTCGQDNPEQLLKHHQFLLTLETTAPDTLILWAKILKGLAEHAALDDVGQIVQVQMDLVANHTFLAEIAALFDYPPYPTMKQILPKLQSNYRDLNSFMGTFDKDPYGMRAAQYDVQHKMVQSEEDVLKEQFATTELSSILASMRNVSEGSSLSNKQQYDLAQQLTYINAIGKDYPLTQGKISYSNLTQISRGALRELSDSLINEIRAIKVSPENKLKAQLNLLAVMREQYFRTTGHFPSLKQMSVLLLLLNHPEEHLLIDRCAKKDKEAVTALFAAMEWVNAKGATVDVCRTETGLINEYFFTDLGIPTAVLDSSSKVGSYQIGGINYASIEDLTVYRYRAKLNHELLTTQHHGITAPTHLILDIPELSSINNRLLFDFSLTAQDLMNSYKDEGHIVALVTKKVEPTQLNYFNNAAYSVPSDNKDKSYLPQHPILDWTQYLANLNKQIARRHNEQPILLIVKDADEAKDLFQKLNSTEGEHAPLIINSFTGDETNEMRQHCVNQAGNANTLTIMTAESFVASDWNIHSAQDFLMIQTYMDTPEITQSILDGLGMTRPAGQYIALYEDAGCFFARAWPYESEQDKAVIMAGVGALRQRQNEELAVERHYSQAVCGIKGVVLQQFEEWHALLLLIYPQAEWNKLKADLLILREELMHLLDEQWNQSLADFEFDLSHPYPLLQRDSEQKLQTNVLESVLVDYERAVTLIWEAQRDIFKEKTTGKIPKDSVNVLRANYLEDIKLSEQLHLNKLQVQKNKKRGIKEKKDIARYLHQGLDVNGAMIKYSVGKIEQYQALFLKSHLSSLKDDIIKALNRSTLIPHQKLLLTRQIGVVTNVKDLEQFLIDYNQRWVGVDQLTEKYRMQPVVGELLRIYQQAKLAPSVELHVLKNHYFNHVATELVGTLEKTLSWARSPNQGVLYWLERSAVKEAAQDILSATVKIRNAPDSAYRDAALKHLYRVLTEHQAKLKDVWIFSFGHQNTRDLINKTLHGLEDLAVISSDKEQLTPDFIINCREQAQNEIMKERLNIVLGTLEEKHALHDSSEWQSMREDVNAIQKTNNTVYGVDELYSFLSHKIKELQAFNSKLFQPVIELRGELRTIWSTFSQKHQDLVNDSKYFELKGDVIKDDLNNTAGLEVSDVTIKAGQIGFGDYIDVMIEGTGSIPLLDNFVRYQQPLLNKEYEPKKAAYNRFNDQRSRLGQFQRNILPLLRISAASPIPIESIPALYKERMQELMKLKECALGTCLSGFSPLITQHILDRQLVASMNLHECTLEQINQLNNQQLKEEFLDLYNKLHQPPRSLWSTLKNFGMVQESVDDWAYQFAALQERPNQCLHAVLSEEINKGIDLLSADLEAQEQSLSHEMNLLKEQMDFLNVKIKSAECQSKVMVKRFVSRGEFYQFANELRAYKEAHPKLIDSAPAMLLPQIEEDIDNSFVLNLNNPGKSS
jgi:hypothetical protein